MTRLPLWLIVGGALLVVLVADRLDRWRPFPPVLRAHPAAKRG